MEPMLLAEVTQWLVLNPKDKRIQEDGKLKERTMGLHDVVEHSSSSEMKFNLVYIPAVIYQLHELAPTHLTSLALASSRC